MTQDTAQDSAHFAGFDTGVDLNVETPNDTPATDAYGNTATTPPSLRMRADGWFPARQRVFLESIARSGIVTQACDECGMSPRAAYTLRLRADGIGFRLGWEAAILIARARLVDTLMDRAINGWEEVVTRFADDSDERIRHRIDNRLAMSLLGRLDKRAEVPLTEGTDAALARIIAQDFEAFLDLIESGAGGAAISLFLALRTPRSEEANPHQNDAIGRCELCGADHGDGAPEDAHEDPYHEAIAGMGVWCEDPTDPEDPYSWRTEYPAPPNFDGEEWGTWNSDWYERTLTDQELEAHIARKNTPGTAQADELDFLRAAEQARDAYFGFVAGEKGELISAN
jgi:hypothetical protein